jgi:hypothetical protein
LPPEAFRGAVVEDSVLDSKAFRLVVPDRSLRAGRGA